MDAALSRLCWLGLDIASFIMTSVAIHKVAITTREGGGGERQKKKEKEEEYERAISSSSSSSSSSSTSTSPKNGAVLILSADDVFRNFKNYGLGKRDKYLAFYSSVYGGIVTNELLMSIPMDDHLCHRGHAVFDTATVENGFLYNLDVHLARILKSAEMAGIKHTFSSEWIKSVIIAVSKASGDLSSLSIRYWISSGAGDFSFSPDGCIAPSFYCIAFKGWQILSSPKGITDVTISTSEVGMKPYPIGILKSTNYLANVLLHLAAKKKGGHYGLWVGADGFIKEGPINSIVILDQYGIVRSPPFNDILASCTCNRILDILRTHGYDARQEEITPAEAYLAKEIFLVGGDTHIIAVTTLDGHIIGTGLPGPLWKLVSEAVLHEAKAGALGERLEL
jgi:4-amino-4-deoxychorismate lyase